MRQQARSMSSELHHSSPSDEGRREAFDENAQKVGEGDKVMEENLSTDPPPSSWTVDPKGKLSSEDEREKPTVPRREKRNRTSMTLKTTNFLILPVDGE